MDYEEQCDDTVDNHKASDVDNVESGSPASTVAFPENDESAGGANQSAEDSGQFVLKGKKNPPNSYNIYTVVYWSA